MDNSLGGIDCWETLHAIHCGESVEVVENTSYFPTSCLVKIFRPLKFRKENPTRSIIITVRNHTRQANDAAHYGKILRRIDNKKLGRVNGNMRNNIATCNSAENQPMRAHQSGFEAQKW
ncbi:hypothetical protein P5673_002837 [Acropora cervicornis]|uniref:Uncharacterized protein n=1 Tax=Acropora cervicornis TaxID=6130 RepID=A0AAD9R3S6_ACRCE|nr:hypothetical protein P5673_002837 [Acropora cervicornis]